MPQINGMQPASGQVLREEGLSYNIADATEMSMGGKGCKVIVDGTKTDANAGQSFVAIHCLTDTVLAAYTVRQYAPVTPTNVLVGVILPAGMVLYGQFTSLTLTSGTVIAYNGVNNAGA
jgi:hypothetical protein